MKNYARTLQDLQWLLLHERVFHLHVSKQAAQIACNTVLPAQEPKQYCLRSNFQMVFFEKVSCHRFWKKCFQTQSRDIASCHYYSVILEVYFWKYRTVFEIFINITIQKLSCRWYAIHGKAIHRRFPCLDNPTQWVAASLSSTTTGIFKLQIIHRIC